MGLFVNQAGVWTEVKELHTHHGGNWTPVKEAFVNEEGVWKKYYSLGPVYPQDSVVYLEFEDLSNPYYINLRDPNDTSIAKGSAARNADGGIKGKYVYHEGIDGIERVSVLGRTLPSGTFWYKNEIGQRTGKIIWARNTTDYAVLELEIDAVNETTEVSVFGKTASESFYLPHTTGWHFFGYSEVDSNAPMICFDGVFYDLGFEGEPKGQINETNFDVSSDFLGLDQVHLFNRNITSDEILQLYNNGVGIP